jgi:hypothetical protein
MAANFIAKLFKLPSLPSSSSSSSILMLTGRWALDYDSTVQEKKVYWANMDNCGCCNVVEDNEYEYMLPYVT